MLLSKYKRKPEAWNKHVVLYYESEATSSVHRHHSPLQADSLAAGAGTGEDSCESLGLQGDPASPFWRRSVLGVHWWDWFWSWNSNTLATWCEELTYLKRPWCWEGLGAGGEGDDRGWDGWMASPTQWKWVWVDSGSWWWTSLSITWPGMLQFMWSQRVGHDWATELNWTELSDLVLFLDQFSAIIINSIYFYIHSFI